MYDVNHLKETQMEILHYITQVCNENKIEFFLTGGTLLGAVRHSGYIPWDDDIDIALLRPEYNRLVSVLLSAQDNKIDERFSTLSFENDDYNITPFTKVIRNGTMCIEEKVQNVNYAKGVFVDVFPFDAIDPSKKTTNKVVAWLIAFLTSVRISKMQNRKVICIKDLIRFPFRLINITAISKLIRSLVERISDNTSNVYTCFYGTKRKQYFNKDSILPLKTLWFEDGYYPVPNKAEVILRIMYGQNFMEIPKPENRRTHQFKEVTWQDKPREM